MCDTTCDDVCDHPEGLHIDVEDLCDYLGCPDDFDFEMEFEENVCDPDNTKPEDEDFCEGTWEDTCNPDDVDPRDEDFCDWIGFTADIEWIDAGNYLEKNLRGRL